MKTTYTQKDLQRMAVIALGDVRCPCSNPSHKYRIGDWNISVTLIGTSLKVFGRCKSGNMYETSMAI